MTKSNIKYNIEGNISNQSFLCYELIPPEYFSHL